MNHASNLESLKLLGGGGDQRTLRKDTTGHAIHSDVKFTSQCYNPENFSNSTIKLQMPISLKLCKVRKNN